MQGELNDTKLLVLSGVVELELVESGQVTTLTEGQEFKVSDDDVLTLVMVVNQWWLEDHTHLDVHNQSSCWCVDYIPC